MKHLFAMFFALLITLPASSFAKVEMSEAVELLERYHSGDRVWLFEHGSPDYRAQACGGAWEGCPFIDHGEFPPVVERTQTFKCTPGKCFLTVSITYADEIPLPGFDDENRDAVWKLRLNGASQLEEVTIENPNSADRGVFPKVLATLLGWFVVLLAAALATAIPRR